MICFMRGLSLKGIGAIWLLSLVCLLMRIIVSFLRYTVYLKFIKDPIHFVSHVLMLILAHVLLLRVVYMLTSFFTMIKTRYKIFCNSN